MKISDRPRSLPFTSCANSFALSGPQGGPQAAHERGVAFVSLKEGPDLSTAAGRLQLHILSALGEFERARLIERTRAGLARARRQGTRLGRRPVRLAPASLAEVAQLPVRDAARQLGVSVNTYRKARGAVGQQTPAAAKLAQTEAA